MTGCVLICSRWGRTQSWGQNGKESGVSSKTPGTWPPVGRGLRAGDALCLNDVGTRPLCCFPCSTPGRWVEAHQATVQEEPDTPPAPPPSFHLTAWPSVSPHPQAVSFSAHCIQDIPFLQSSTSSLHLYSPYLELSAPCAQTTQVGCKPLPLSCFFPPYFSPCTYKLLSHKVMYGFSFCGISKALLVFPWGALKSHVEASLGGGGRGIWFYFTVWGPETFCAVATFSAVRALSRGPVPHPRGGPHPRPVSQTPFSFRGQLTVFHSEVPQSSTSLGFKNKGFS